MDVFLHTDFVDELNPPNDQHCTKQSKLVFSPVEFTTMTTFTKIQMAEVIL